MADMRTLDYYKARSRSRSATAGGFDIALVGDVELQRKLNQLAYSVQRKLVARAFKKAGTEIIKPRIVEAVPVDTGLLKQQMRRQRFKGAKAPRGRVKVGIPMPTREQMGIGKESKGYYPAFVEYGTKRMAPRSYIRKPTDESAAAFYAATGRILGREIEAEARKQ